MILNKGSTNTLNKYEDTDRPGPKKKVNLLLHGILRLPEEQLKVIFRT